MSARDQKSQAANSEKAKQARNEDPMTGEPGSHPVGSGLGAAVGGAAVGAAAGSVAGPIGTIAGTIAGGIAGAYAGKAVAESIDPTVESAYWNTEYRNRPYTNKDRDYSDYGPAYRAGWESYTPDDTWEAREPIAKKKWEESWESEGGAPRLTWEEAQAAARDAYYRVHAQSRPDVADASSVSKKCS